MFFNFEKAVFTAISETRVSNMDTVEVELEEYMFTRGIWYQCMYSWFDPSTMKHNIVSFKFRMVNVWWGGYDNHVKVEYKFDRDWKGYYNYSMNLRNLIQAEFDLFVYKMNKPINDAKEAVYNAKQKEYYSLIN